MTSAAPPQSSLDRHNAIASDYFGKLLECHNAGQSENDIRTAFRDFIIRTGIIADESEIKSEVPPGSDSSRRVDLYTRNTYIEFKRNIVRGGEIDPDYIAQLDGYLLASVKSGWGIQNGILTDGVNYLKRSIGDHLRPLSTDLRRIYNRPGQGPLAGEYISAIINTDGADIKPGSETLTRHFGIDSDLLKQATALLIDAHNDYRNHPTVAVKRKLWQELLQVALGQDSTGDPEAADWLFIRHTYLTTLTALILQAHFGIDVARQAETNPAGLLNGATLNASAGLKGVIESDLFQWPGEVGQTEYVRCIARKVAQFDWSHRAAELAAILYQNTITPEERRRMGEYYTPRWLAQAIVAEMVDDPLNTVAMDPSCGSGTFIECLVQNAIAAGRNAGRPAGDILQKLQSNIIGIDLHPVAVQLAKATYVLNCHEIITEARANRAASSPAPAEIAPPIYLGDSLQLRYDRNTLAGQGYVTLLTNEQPAGETAPVQFQIPMSLARATDRFDRLMLDLAIAIDRRQDTDRVLFQHQIAEGSELDTMRDTAAQMEKLHASDRNHVWAYYLRNMVRPAVIAEQKVDAIVGNPPWLTYNKSADIVREELLNLSKDTYGIWGGGKNSANQDVATLFFCRVIDSYLKDGGKIGMVLPHSVLRSGQHYKWRAGYWANQKGRSKTCVSVDFRVKTPWDLDNLEPTFFPMPGSVVFAQNIGKTADLRKGKQAAGPLAPARVEMWRGTTDSPSVTRYAEALHHDDGAFHSPYSGLAARGADIFDRRLFFVSAAPNDGLMAVPGTFRTYPRTGGQDKKTYDVSALDGHIVHDDNLFAVHLGETIAPYIALQPLTAALPVSKATMTMPLDHSRCSGTTTGKVKHDACRVDIQALDARMQERWPVMESLWDANKGKSDTKSLAQNLNWLNKLTSQLEYLSDPGDCPVRVAYATSGRPTAALVDDDTAIVDTKLYQVACRDIDEAHYLLAIINSNTLETMVAPFRAKGLYGERDLHKHLWKLPIPVYDPANALHIRLSDLGKVAAATVAGIIAGTAYGSPEKARQILRHQWQPASPTAQAIEKAVAELLTPAAETGSAPDRAVFERLADEWVRERPRGRDIHFMIEHPAYQQIIALGPAAAPWLLQRLAQRPDHWFVALHRITGASPVPPESRGRFGEMTAAWLEWGRQQGYAWEADADVD